LVRSAINTPVEDARLAASVFEDQWQAFNGKGEKDTALMGFYRFCFQDSFFNTFSSAGISSVFSALSPLLIKTPDDGFGCF
jgi:ATP-dependent DNA helicase RecQ